jgi:TonB family protein
MVQELRWVSPAFRNKQGTTTIEFVLHQDGNITDERVAWSSKDPDLDAAASNAVNHAGHLPAFPATVKTDRLRLQFRFDYNPDKVAN